jgi:hypothetical protein
MLAHLSCALQLGDTAKKSTLRRRQMTAHQNRTNSFAKDAVAGRWGSEFKPASRLGVQAELEVGLALRTPVPLQLGRMTS